MNNILKYDDCANCGACYNVCPTNAIRVDENEIYYILHVEEEKCIQCGKCLSVCPVNEKKENISPKKAFGAWHKQTEIVMKSSSGGVFCGLAQKVLEKNGVVYGAAFGEDYKTVRLCSTDEVSLDALMKSKYVESLVEHSFQDVKEKLHQGRLVLFSGTPCQIHGLKSYLKTDYKKLICCDFACGGLPSHKIYQEYLMDLENKYQSKVVKVDFRPKTHGWNRYAMWIEFENGKVYNKLGILDEYYRAFLYGKYSVRDYCTKCSFAEEHAADITVADFWKYESMSKLSNQTGISLVLCNTEKGLQLFGDIKNEYEIEEIDLEQASYNLKNVFLDEMQNTKRENFLRDYVSIGLKQAVEKQVAISKKQLLKSNISNIINRRKKWDKKN